MLLICFIYSGGSVGKESACNAGDLSLIPGSRRYSGKGNGNVLQYSCLENAVDRGAWQATVNGMAKSQIWLCDWLSLFTFHVSVNPKLLINASLSFSLDKQKFVFYVCGSISVLSVISFVSLFRFHVYLSYEIYYLCLMIFVFLYLIYLT